MELSYTTDRLLLKVLNSNDSCHVLDFYINNKDHLNHWEPKKVDNFYTLSYQAVILSFEYSKYLSKDLVRLWILDKNNPDKIIGTFSFSNILRSTSQSCVLGYKLDKDYVGHGIMTEAIQKGIDIVFNEYRLHRIEALVMPSNTSSINLLKRLGFTYEGTSRELYKIDGIWEDHERYSLINKFHF
jgi:ribosomal-protein-alanine N-acetyltransferase